MCGCIILISGWLLISGSQFFRPMEIARPFLGQTQGNGKVFSQSKYECCLYVQKASTKVPFLRGLQPEIPPPQRLLIQLYIINSPHQLFVYNNSKSCRLQVHLSEHTVHLVPDFLNMYLFFLHFHFPIQINPTAMQITAQKEQTEYLVIQIAYQTPCTCQTVVWAGNCRESHNKTLGLQKQKITMACHHQIKKTNWNMSQM